MSTSSDFPLASRLSLVWTEQPIRASKAAKPITSCFPEVIFTSLSNLFKFWQLWQSWQSLNSRSPLCNAWDGYRQMALDCLLSIQRLHHCAFRSWNIGIGAEIVLDPQKIR